MITTITTQSTAVQKSAPRVKSQPYAQGYIITAQPLADNTGPYSLTAGLMYGQAAAKQHFQVYPNLALALFNLEVGNFIYQVYYKESPLRSQTRELLTPEQQEVFCQQYQQQTAAMNFFNRQQSFWLPHVWVLKEINLHDVGLKLLIKKITQLRLRMLYPQLVTDFAEQQLNFINWHLLFLWSQGKIQAGHQQLLQQSLFQLKPPQLLQLIQQDL